MNKLLLLLAMISGIVATGCSTEIGGPKLDNKSGTYANDMEVKKLNYLNSPAPKQ